MKVPRSHNASVLNSAGSEDEDQSRSPKEIKTGRLQGQIYHILHPACEVKEASVFM